jgi:hypothetical protein
MWPFSNHPPVADCAEKKKEVSEPVLGTSESSILLRQLSYNFGLALSHFTAGVSPRVREKNLT